MKQKILDTSLRLFNEKSVAAVSMRDIASELSISPGNLTYYFSKKENIVDAIIMLQYEEYKSSGYRSDIDLKQLNEQFIKMIKHQKKYYFYFHSFTELSRLYPNVMRMQVIVRNEFHSLFLATFSHFVDIGIAKCEKYIKSYDDLAFVVMSVIMYWVQQTTLENDKVTSNRNILSVIWNIIVPNLTEKGQEEYNRLIIMQSLGANQELEISDVKRMEI